MEGNLLHMEQIEAYILNKMDSGQKAAFEQLLAQDPLVNQEFEIQKDIIKTIQDTRKSELKARLNKIEVNGSGWSNAAKVAASLLLISSIGAGAYFFNNPNSKPDGKSIEITNETSNTVKTITPSTTTVEVENTIPQTEPVSEKLVKSEKLAPIAVQSPKATPTPVATTPVNIPQISDNFADADNLDKSISLPNATIAKTVDTKAKLDVSLIDEAGEIAYQYYNNKLFLFGKFSAGKYEILELNNASKKEMYLYFNNQYYYLNPNTFDKIQLESIKNQEIKNQLELIREK